MSRTAPRSMIATTIVALYTRVKADAICGVGTWGCAIHTGAVIGKAIWKLRLALMAFN